MKQFKHPHIIKLFGVVTQGLTTYIVMELAPLGQVCDTCMYIHIQKPTVQYCLLVIIIIINKFITHIILMNLFLCSYVSI